MTTTETTTGTTQGRSRAKRSLHPGVKIKKPNPGHRMTYYRLAYTDPDSSKESYERLDEAAYPTAKARKERAIRKSIEIRQRAAAIRDGARKATGADWQELIDLYFDHHPQLREDTADGYKTSLENFKTWADSEGSSAAPDMLTRATLMKYRAWAMKLKKKRVARGAKKGETRELDSRRSAITVNRDLRVAGTLLTWLIDKAERMPKLHLDDLKKGLEKYDVEHKLPEFQTRKEIAQSLDAAIRHDAAVFKKTRDEKKKLGERKDSANGSTSRYKPIAPFIATAYLAGFRLAEECLIEWREHVKLDHEDVEGNPVGMVKLKAENTKTHRERHVFFNVSPMLRELFLALREVAEDKKGSVFGISYDEAQDACQRLREDHDAPENLNFKMTRSTCSTYLVNAPGIYGAAASFHSAKQLGHSQAVQEKHYAGLLPGIKPEHKTLEAAMQIEPQLRLIIDAVKKSKTAT